MTNAAGYLDEHILALPSGDGRDWPTVPLSDGLITNLQTGFACGEHNRDGRGIVHIRPMNVTSEGDMELTNVKYVPTSEADRDERIVRAGDVIFNNTNSPELVGKTALYSEAEPRAFSNHMTRLRVNQERIRPHFLALALHQLWREGYFADKCNNHVSQASISRAVLLETRVTLPPTDVQDSLLLQISKLQQPVNSARGRLDSIPILLKRFRQSVLAEACSGQLTVEWRNSISCEKSASWKSVRLSEVSDSKLGKMLDKAKNRGRLQPYLRNTNVRWHEFELTDLSEMRFEDSEAERYGLVRGDVLICEGGEPGRCAVWMKDESPIRFQKAIHRVRCKDSLSPFFLVYLLEHLRDSGDLQNYFTGTGISHLTGKALATIRFDLPLRTEQDEIVRRVDRLFALAYTIESRLADATNQINRTTQAILAKAFRGELSSRHGGELV